MRAEDRALARLPFQARTVGLLMAFVAMLLVSTDSLITRAADADGWTVAFWYGVFTTPVMAAILAAQGRTAARRALVEGGAPLLASGVCQLISTLLFILAIKNTSVANVVVIVAAAPVLGALASRLALGERTSRRVWTAIASSLVGILVVVSGSLGGGAIGGDLLALGAISAFAANLTIWRRHPEMHRVAAVGIAGFLMAVVAALPADVWGHAAETYLLLALMGAVLGPLGRVMLASSTRYASVSEVALMTPVETVAAITWAWIAFGEQPDPATWVGGTIVLAAVLYGSTGRLGPSPIAP